MQPSHYSSLLPEVFRHKTTRVRILKPQAILLDFHGTISERHWEDKVIYPYVKKALPEYLRQHWANEIVQRCLPGLKNESFEQRFRHKYEEAPIIEDISANYAETGAIQLIEQVSDFLLWQISSKRETRETQTIERLVWQDGFKERKILTPIYEDVLPCIKSWVEQHNCNTYVISSVDETTLRLLFNNTEKGDLNKYISGYLSSKKLGDKIISDIYKQFYEKMLHDSRLKLAASHQSKSPKMIDSSKTSSSGGSPRSPKNPSTAIINSKSSPRSSPPLTAMPSENLAKPILFITDSGQEAKAASEVANGNAYECLLINRPGNKRIRTYYLSQFQYMDKFEDIEFIE